MGLEGVPTLYTFKDGELVDRLVGLQTLEKYIEFLERTY